MGVYNLDPGQKKQQEKVNELSGRIWGFLHSWWKKEKDLTIQEALEVQIASLSTCFAQSLVNLIEYLELDKMEYLAAVDKLLEMTREDMLKEEILSKFS
jgi:hypothetical protein